MAGLKFNIDADVNKLQKLRIEISNLKDAMTGLRGDELKSLETQLKSLTNQYDAIVSKVADAEARISLSAKNINDATEKIVKAQEKIINSAKSPNNKSPENNSSGGSSSQENSAQTGAETQRVQEQAKAYQQLKEEIDDILGSRSANIARMMEEMNSIRLVNAEMKKIMNYQEDITKLSDTERMRLEQLNNSLLTHKTALSEIRILLNNNAKLDNSAATSMDAISQSLGRMRAAYRMMTEDERNSPIGKELVASIQQADTRIKALDATIGNHQRNVGNYAGSFNMLQFNMQQVVRELPSLYGGLSIFFLAISNNIPMLSDSIIRARNDFKALKAENKEAIPVWKQLASSLFSWQTAMVVGITLLTMYGKQIGEWVSNLFSANSSLAENLNTLDEFKDKTAESASSVIANLQKMSNEWNNLGGNLKDKEEYIANHKSAMDSLGVSITSVDDAEKIFNSHKSEFISSILQRAKAAAAMGLAADKYKEAIKTMQDLDNRKAGGVSVLDNLKSMFFTYGHAKLDEDTTPGAMYKQGVSSLQKKLDKLLNDAINTTIKGVSFSENETAILKKMGIKSTESTVKGSVASINNIISLLKSKQENATNKTDYDNIQKKIDLYTKKLESITGGKDNSAQIAREAKQQNTYNEALRKQKIEEANLRADLQQKISEMEISAMEEGSEKKRRQIDESHKKQLEEIDKNEKAAQNKEIENARAVFTSNPKNKGKIFDASSVSMPSDIKSQYDKERELANQAYLKQLDDQAISDNNAMNDYLQKYGTFQQQKLAIAQEYIDKIRKATSEGEKLSLQKERDQKISSVTTEDLKANIDWSTVFDGFGTMLIEQMKSSLESLQAYTKTDEFKNAQPTEKKTIYDAISKLETEIGGNLKDIDLKKVGQELNAYRQSIADLNNAKQKEKEAINQLVDAQKKLEDAQKSGSIKAAEAAQKNVDMAKSIADSSSEDVKNATDNTTQTGENLKNSSVKAMGAINSVSEGLQKLSSGSLKDAWEGFEILDKNLNGNKITESIAKALGSTGSIIGQIISAILSILDIIAKQGIGGLVEGVLETVLTAIGRIIGDLLNGKMFEQIGIGLFNGVSSILKPIGQAFGLGGLWGGADYSEYNDLKKKYEDLIKVWDDLISKKKEYLSESYGSEIIRTESEIQALLQKEIVSYQTLGKARLNSGASTGSHSIGYRNYKNLNAQSSSELVSFFGTGNFEDVLGSRMENLFNMSWQQLEKLKEEAPTFWAGLDTDVQTYLNDIIAAGQAADDALDSAKEKLLGISFDSFVDNFASMLDDLSSDVDTFSDDFGKKLEKSIINSLIVNKYKDQLKTLYNSWYEQLSSASTSGTSITSGQYDAFKTQLESIVGSAVNERDALANLFGWTSSDSTSGSTSSTSVTASQDSVDEANGRMTAIETVNTETRDLTQLNLAQLTAIGLGLTSISGIADETRSILNNSYLELQGIHEDTSSMVKPIKSIADDIAQVRKNTNNL